MSLTTCGRDFRSRTRTENCCNILVTLTENVGTHFTYDFDIVAREADRGGRCLAFLGSGIACGGGGWRVRGEPAARPTANGAAM